MTRQILTLLTLVLAVAFTTSCSLAPITPRVDAASVGKGVFKIENNVSPSSFSVIYGAGEKFDVGLDLELIMATAWGRYSFFNSPNGFSLAVNGGVFVGDADIKSNGYFSGLIASNQWSPKFRTTASVRYAELDYQFSPEYDDDYWFDWYDAVFFDNSEEGSANIQADLTLSFLVKPYIELALGAVCQHLPRVKDSTRRSEGCVPTIGFSYYRL